MERSHARGLDQQSRCTRIHDPISKHHSQQAQEHFSDISNKDKDGYTKKRSSYLAGSSQLSKENHKYDQRKGGNQGSKDPITTPLHKILY